MTDDPLSHSWQWQEWQGLSYLTCSLLADFQHGFFTRQFYPRDPQELVGVLDSRRDRLSGQTGSWQ